MSEAIWAAIGIILAAVCVWLGVRIFNRRERWAKRTAVTIAILCVLFVISSGPLRRAGFNYRLARVPGGTSLSWKEEEAWWPSAFAPLIWASNHWWGEPFNWYWRFFPINVTIDEA